MDPIRLCVVGADGRMGQEVIRCAGEEFSVVGAVTHSGSPNEGKTLSDLGLPGGELRIENPGALPTLLREADLYLSFTTPDAETVNIPVVAGAGKKIVTGTTGFDQAQQELLRSTIEGKTEAVMSYNFSIGINFLAGVLSRTSALPKGYDASMYEIHHTGKVDSPSGTALLLGDILSEARSYSKVVHGRSGKGTRGEGELEISALRAGGVPGIHEVIFAGPNEMIRISHTAFSRKIFAEGALLAARWLMGVSDRKIHSMREVLGV